MTSDAESRDGTPRPAPERLRRRAEFLAAAGSGLARHAPAFKLQMTARPDEDGPPRFGLTVTKKVANAVGRNRIRRRLREALRLSGLLAAKPGRDYVFVARRAALHAPFDALQTQMTDSLRRLGAVAAKPPTTTKNRPKKP